MNQKTRAVSQRLFCLVAIFGTLAFAFAACSHDEHRRAVPVVTNHDGDGLFFIPSCPLCKAAPVKICTEYTCPVHGAYQTRGIDLAPGVKP